MSAWLLDPLRARVALGLGTWQTLLILGPARPEQG